MTGPEKVCPTCDARYPAVERFCPKDGTALRSSDRADLVGSVIGERYHVLQKLGEGGMGQVYLAEHVKMGRKSAVKVMNAHLADDADAIGRFNREAANASRVNHPNVAGIYDFGETADGLTFLAMEYIEGRSLTSLVKEEGALSPDRAAEIIRQASLGLQSAHDMGIVHRDLKPDNIMLAQDKDGADLVKVVDFGIAKATGGGGAQKVTQTGVIVGTPEYMSPEQVSGDELDGRSDTYSLALVAFHILTGQLPFDSGSTQEALFMRLTDEPASLADVRPDVKWPSDVQKVIRKALDPDRERRYQSAAVFGAELSAAVARMPRTAMRPSKAVLYNSATRMSTEAGIAIGAQSSPRTRRRLKTAGDSKRTAIIVGVTAVVVAVAIAMTQKVRSAQAGPPRLAVLPFENRSVDTADAFLADGFTEELANRVSRVPQLSVLSNTAVRRVKNVDAMSIPEIGRLLGANYLLSGSVKRVGGRLNVSVELALASSGEKVWGDSYDRAQSSLPVLMREIAVAAATGMLGTLPPEAQAQLTAPTQNAAAYELYLRGNRTRLAEGGAELGQSIAAYEGALALDPKFAAAQGRLAGVYARAIFWTVPLPGMSAGTVMALGARAADRALALDSASADAWAGRGFVLFFGRQDYPGAVAALGRAAALDSMNAVVHHARGQILRRLGDIAGAEAATRAAIATDPGFGQAYNQMAILAYTARRPKEALALSDTAIRLNPEEWQHWQIRAHIYMALQDTARARQDAEQALKISPPAQIDYSLLVLAQAQARSGDTARARQTLQPVTAKLPATGTLTPRYYQTALAQIAAGQPDDGLKTLERIKPRGAWLWSYLVMPSFDPVRTDPRFVKLVNEARPPGAAPPLPQ